MAYGFHIDKLDKSPISKEEFINLPSKIENIRRVHNPKIEGINPSTKGPIKLVIKKGEALEVFSNELNEWHLLFRLVRGSISLKAVFNPQDKNCTVRNACYAIAKELNASITGDDGQTYDDDGNSYYLEDEESSCNTE